MLVETAGETTSKQLVLIETSQAKKPEKSRAWRVQHSSDRSTWRTPNHIFRAIDADFGFDLDAAACKASRLCAAYYGPDHRRKARRDALSANWVLENGAVPAAAFVNPPYGRNLTNKWVETAWENSRKMVVVALVMACTETVWWRTWAWRADEIRLVQSRIKFVDPDLGTPVGGAPKGSAIVVFRPHVPAEGWTAGPRVSLWEQPDPTP